MAYTFKHGDRPLNGFTIQRAAGRGGFGEVYYAVSDGGREVALKYLCQNPEVELRGVSQCMNLKSPHLVSIFDVKKSADGDYFIVMEYISGPSLRDHLLAEPSGLGVEKAAYFLGEIAKGLGYLHDRGIVHRDLKPGNIFCDDGYVKIGDYGLSKFISVSRHSAQTSSVGTVHYMAPEVGSGNYSRTIDIYALGVMLYEMLMGKVPFGGSSMGEVLMKHLTAQPELDQLPAPFAEVIRKALAKDPQDRYQTVEEMMAPILASPELRNAVKTFGSSEVAESIYAAPDRVEEFDSPRRSPNPIPVLETDYGWNRREVAAEPQRQLLPGQVRARSLPVAEPARAAIRVPRDSRQITAQDSCHYAGFWIRVIAAVIDSAVVTVVAVILTGGNPQALLPILGIVYEGVLVGRWNGQTIGKRACGVKVIAGDGSPCSIERSFGRAASKLLSSFLLGIGYLMVAFGYRKQGLHDRIAGTYVVYEAK